MKAAVVSMIVALFPLLAFAADNEVPLAPLIHLDPKPAPIIPSEGKAPACETEGLFRELDSASVISSYAVLVGKHKKMCDRPSSIDLSVYHELNEQIDGILRMSGCKWADIGGIRKVTSTADLCGAPTRQPATKPELVAQKGNKAVVPEPAPLIQNTDPKEVAPKATSGSSIAVLVVRRVNLPTTETTKIADRFTDKLSSAGINVVYNTVKGSLTLSRQGIANTESCEGKIECVTNLGSLLRVSTVVALEFGALRRSIALHATVVSIPDGKTLIQEDATLDREKWESEGSLPLDEAAKKVGLALFKPAPLVAEVAPTANVSKEPSKPVVSKPSDLPMAPKPTPKVAVTEPRPTTEVIKATASEPPRRGKLLKYGSIGIGAAGLVTVGIGAVFGVQALSDFNAAKDANGKDRVEFDSRKQSSRENITRADICYGVGGVALATGIVLFIVDSAMGNSPQTNSNKVSVTSSGNGMMVSGTW